MLAPVNTLSFWLGVLLLAPAKACYDDCIGRDIRENGPILSLNCSRPEFAVAVTDWPGGHVVASLFIQCYNGRNTTCIAVSEEESWYRVLRNTNYLFSELNEVPENSTHNCTVFGCYRRFNGIILYRFPNASCSLAATDVTTEVSEVSESTSPAMETQPPGMTEASTRNMTEAEVTETRNFTEAEATEARNSTEAEVPTAEVTAANRAQLHLTAILIPVVVLLFSVAVLMCYAFMVAQRSVTKKNRRVHYDFGVQDLATDATDTGVEWFDVMLTKSGVSGSVLTLFNHLNRHSHDNEPPEFHHWKKHGQDNDFPDPSDAPCTPEGYCGKLCMEGQTIDATPEGGLDITHQLKDDQKQSSVYLDGHHQVEPAVSPYCGYSISKSIPKSSTCASLDLSIYSCSFNSRQDTTMNLKEPSTSSYDLTDSPQSSEDVGSYQEGGTSCCLTQESTVEMPDLENVESDPQQESLQQSPTGYVPSKELGNFTKGFRNPMHFELAAINEKLLSEGSLQARNLDAESAIFSCYDENYIHN